MSPSTDSVAVQTQWEQLEEEAGAEGLIAIYALLSVARSDSVLGRLYPFLSIGRLCFSRCVDYPFYVDVLISPVHPAEEEYVVELTVGPGGWVYTEPSQRIKDAKKAVQAAATLLPAGYGPARPGNA